VAQTTPNLHGGHHYGEDCTAAKTVGKNANGDSRQRSQKHGNRNQQSGFRRCQVERLAEAGSESADGPHAPKQTVNETVPSAV
jgi:hypothetical protein